MKLSYLQRGLFSLLLISFIVGFLGVMGGSFSTVVEDNGFFRNNTIDNVSEEFELEVNPDLTTRNGTVVGYSGQNVIVRDSGMNVTTRLAGVRLVSPNSEGVPISSERCFESVLSEYRSYMSEEAVGSVVNVVLISSVGNSSGESLGSEVWVSRVLVVKERAVLSSLLLERGFAIPSGSSGVSSPVRNSSSSARALERGVWRCIPEKEEGSLVGG